MTQRRMRSSRVLAHPPCGDWSLARPWRQGRAWWHRDHLERDLNDGLSQTRQHGGGALASATSPLAPLPG